MQCPIFVFASNEIYKSGFIYIESILNASVYFNVSNNFCENKMTKYGWNNITSPFSITTYIYVKIKQHIYSDILIKIYKRISDNTKGQIY